MFTYPYKIAKKIFMSYNIITLIIALIKKRLGIQYISIFVIGDYKLCQK